jgi:hypothetical protein
MAHIVCAWLVTPPVDWSHPKTEVLKVAARRGKIALRAKKVDLAGVMRVVGRGLAEELVAFGTDMYHKVGWKREKLTATQEDIASIESGGRIIIRSDDSVSSGVDSSGRAQLGRALLTVVSDTSSIDTGSSASSRLIVTEVKYERERNEKILAASVAEAAAALQAAAAQGAAALEAAAAAAATREAAAHEASISALMKHASMTRDAATEAMRNAQ